MSMEKDWADYETSGGNKAGIRTGGRPMSDKPKNCAAHDHCWYPECMTDKKIRDLEAENASLTKGFASQTARLATKIAENARLNANATSQLNSIIEANVELRVELHELKTALTKIAAWPVAFPERDPKYGIKALLTARAVIPDPGGRR